jgi:hypothetical protein
LEAGTNGSISFVNHVKIHGRTRNETTYNDVSLSFSDYANLLISINAYPEPSNTVRPDNTSVKITSAGANPNVAANGFYDFILAYYNPDKDGQVVGADNRALLPQVVDTGTFGDKFTFDGLVLPSGITSRNIGGVNLSNMVRKGTATSATPTHGTGQPNTDFIGNLTVPMANYMVSAVRVAEFKNTNIVGPRSGWNNLTDNGDGFKNLILKPTINVGLTGDYDAISQIEGYFQGVIDMKGIVAKYISQRNPRTGYINIWDNVSRDMLGISKFSVVRIHGVGSEKVGTSIVDANSKTFVVIYDKKYNSSLDSSVNNMHPYHRAFVDSSGQIKFSNSAWETGQRKYTGSNSTQPVPFFEEDYWLNNTNPGNYAENYADLATKEEGKYVCSLDDFNAIQEASASPAPLGTRLAAAGHQALDAVLPAKKKPHFMDACLG